MRWFLRWLLGGLTVAGVLVAAPRLYTAVRYAGLIHTPAEAPPVRVALVFGAGVRRDGYPTTVLYDRVATAAELYRLGKVEKLLMSGDGITNSEVAAMRLAALELGVPEGDIVLDPAGQRTYDSCYRAKAIYGATEVLLVTQAFHLPRALYLCEALGLRAAGVSADRRAYRSSTEAFWNFREVLATVAAVWDVSVARPLPVLGEPAPIN